MVPKKQSGFGKATDQLSQEAGTSEDSEHGNVHGQVPYEEGDVRHVGSLQGTIEGHNRFVKNHLTVPVE